LPSQGEALDFSELGETLFASIDWILSTTSLLFTSLALNSVLCPTSVAEGFVGPFEDALMASMFLPLSNLSIFLMSFAS